MYTCISLITGLTSKQLVKIYFKEDVILIFHDNNKNEIFLNYTTVEGI